MRERWGILGPMRHPMAGVTAKLDRGHHHVRELDCEIGAFFDEHPYRIAPEADTEAGWHLARFRIDQDPPIELSVIAGEALGQFRSALDLLMTQLLGVGPKAAVTRNFPIFDPGEFFTATAPGRKPPCEWWRESLRPEHFAVIERLQPRELEQRDGQISEIEALARIRWFTDFDKHELVAPVIYGPQGFGVGRDPNIAGFDWIFVPGNVLHDKAKLYRVAFVDESKMEMPEFLTVSLNFGHGEYPWLTAGTVRACGERVSEIIAELREITSEFRP